MLVNIATIIALSYFSPIPAHPVHTSRQQPALQRGVSIRSLTDPTSISLLLERDGRPLARRAKGPKAIAQTVRDWFRPIPKTELQAIRANAKEGSKDAVQRLKDDHKLPVVFGDDGFKEVEKKLLKAAENAWAKKAIKEYHTRPEVAARPVEVTPPSNPPNPDAAIVQPDAVSPASGRENLLPPPPPPLPLADLGSPSPEAQAAHAAALKALQGIGKTGISPSRVHLGALLAAGTTGALLVVAGEKLLAGGGGGGGGGTATVIRECWPFLGGAAESSLKPNFDINNGTHKAILENWARQPMTQDQFDVVFNDLCRYTLTDLEHRFFTELIPIARSHIVQPTTNAPTLGTNAMPAAAPELQAPTSKPASVPNSAGPVTSVKDTKEYAQPEADNQPQVAPPELQAPTSKPASVPNPAGPVTPVKDTKEYAQPEADNQAQGAVKQNTGFGGAGP